MKHCGMYSLTEVAKMLGVRTQSFYHHKRVGHFKTDKCSPYAVSADSLKKYVRLINTLRKRKIYLGRRPQALKLPSVLRKCVGCKHLIVEEEVMKRTGLSHGSILFKMHQGRIEGHYMPCQKMMFDPKSLKKDFSRSKHKYRQAIYPRIQMLRVRFKVKGDMFTYKDLVAKSLDEMTKLGKLNAREVEILRNRMAIGLPVALSLDSIGKRFGITRERIRQLESKALYKISAYCQGIE